MSFGKRSSSTQFTATANPGNTRNGHLVRGALAACFVGAGLYVTYAALGPKPFPSDGTVFEQCAYAVREIGPSALMPLCSINTKAAEMVEGYRLWEKYANVDPNFPWLSSRESRCNAAVAEATMTSLQTFGVEFANIDKCAFEQDQKELVELYFGFKKGMAKR
jgi:hypothetical protein